MRAPSIASPALVVAFVACLAAGCGDDDPALEVNTGEICGEVGPFKLLALDEDERLLANGALRRIGDAYYITAGREPRTPAPEYGDNWPTHEHTTTYRVGLCGEDRGIVAHDLTASLFTTERWPDAPLACQGEDLVSIDVTGDAAPTVILPRGCSPGRRTVDEGLVLREEVGEETYRLLYHRYDDGPDPGFSPAIELFSALRRSVTLGDEVLGLGDDHVLRRVSLVDQEISVEDEGVIHFAATADHLLWRSDADDEAVILRDRQSAAETVVGHGAISPWGLHLDDEFARIARPGVLDGDVLIDLSDGDIHPIPPGRWAVRQVDDGRWLVAGSFSGPWLLRELDSGAETFISARAGYPRMGGDRLEIIEGAAANLDARESGRLWRVRYDGSPEELLAHRAAPTFVTLTDGRIVTPVGVNADWIGELVVVDPATLDERRIDGPVFNFTGRQAVFGSIEPDVLVYQVVDGERTGVYLVRLAG
ncbi:MAG: hypothetical protein IPK80_07115 [Nannocystis sp.]|nr:hypothetical protein [Nannocystis sp.]